MAESGKAKVLQNTGKFVSENRTEGYVLQRWSKQSFNSF